MSDLGSFSEAGLRDRNVAKCELVVGRCRCENRVRSAKITPAPIVEWNGEDILRRPFCYAALAQS